MHPFEYSSCYSSCVNLQKRVISISINIHKLPHRRKREGRILEKFGLFILSNDPQGNKEQENPKEKWTPGVTDGSGRPFVAIVNSFLTFANSWKTSINWKHIIFRGRVLFTRPNIDWAERVGVREKGRVCRNNNILKNWLCILILIMQCSVHTIA